MSNAIKVTQDQKDWEDFFAPESDFENQIDPVHLYAERVRVACELSGRKIQPSNKRLDEQKNKEKIRLTIEFEFDR